MCITFSCSAEGSAGIVVVVDFNSIPTGLYLSGMASSSECEIQNVEAVECRLKFNC